MDVDLKLSAWISEVIGPHVDAARAAGCSLFRMHYDETQAVPVCNVRLEWPTEPGSKAKSVWRRSGKRSFGLVQNELWHHIGSMVP